VFLFYLLIGCVLQVVVIGWWNLRSVRGAAVEPEREPGELQGAGRVVGDVRWGRE